MRRITRTVTCGLVAILLGCLGPTGFEGETLPVEGVIEARVNYYDVGEPGIPLLYDEEGIYLQLVSRKYYPAGCYGFRTTQSFHPPTFGVTVHAVYRKGALCTAELAPAQEMYFLGDPGDGTYAIQLADAEQVYVGLLEVDGINLTVTFPDTTRFNFDNSIFP